MFNSNWNKKCRACLAIKESYKYFLFDNVSPETYRFCTSIEVHEDERITRALCDGCFVLLEKLFIFKNTCILSQNKLASSPIIEEYPNKNPLDEEYLNIKEECELEVANQMQINSNVEFESDLSEDDVGSQDVCENNESINKIKSAAKDFPKHERNNMVTDKSEEGQETRYVCGICGEKLSDNLLLNRHISKQHKYKCEYCDNYFKDRTTLKKHVLRHEGRQTYKCDLCHKSYLLKASLVEHLKLHMGEKPHKCNYCDKSFVSRRNLVDHCRIHTGERPYKCNICGKSFVQIGTLNRHMKVHDIGGLDQVDSADQEQDEEATESTPISESSNNVTKNSNVNNTQNNDKLELEPNIKLLYRESSWSHVCHTCGKAFATRVLLKSHASRQHGKKEYVCHYCNCQFPDEASLVQHVLIHKGKKEHKCNICHKNCATKASLVEHQRSHTGERPFKCNYCTKAFMTRRIFAGHMKTHTGERRNKCNICNRSYAKRTYLVQHKRKIHKEVIRELNIPVEEE